MFVVFMFRTVEDELCIRPIPARYMHRKEIEKMSKGRKSLPLRSDEDTPRKTTPVAGYLIGSLCLPLRSDEEAERFVAEVDLSECNPSGLCDFAQ